LSEWFCGAYLQESAENGLTDRESVRSGAGRVDFAADTFSEDPRLGGVGLSPEKLIGQQPDAF
jgi:hypothetical protein